MLKIKSQTVSLSSPQEDVYAFLNDLNNYKQLLPEKNISDFSSTEKSCNFKVQSMYNIGFEKDEQITATNVIQLKSSEGSPVNFNLSVHFSQPNGQTEVYLDCEANVSGMVKLMVERPLKDLFSHMAKRLEEIKG